MSDGARDLPAGHHAEFYGRPNSLVRAQYSLRKESPNAGLVSVVRAGHARADDARNEAVLRFRCPRMRQLQRTSSTMLEPKYTRVAMLLHWSTVLLVGALYAIGWSMVDLPKGPSRSATFALHKSIGITVLALTLLRFLWRWGHPGPPLPAAIPVWRATLARGVHAAFYLMLILQPLTGYLSSSFSGYGTQYFGLPLPQWGQTNPPLNEFFTELHVICSVTLLGLIAVHVAGALSHALGPGEALVRRMLPWR